MTEPFDDPLRPTPLFLEQWLVSEDLSEDPETQRQIREQAQQTLRHPAVRRVLSVLEKSATRALACATTCTSPADLQVLFLTLKATQAVRRNLENLADDRLFQEKLHRRPRER